MPNVRFPFVILESWANAQVMIVDVQAQLYRLALDTSRNVKETDEGMVAVDATLEVLNAPIALTTAKCWVARFKQVVNEFHQFRVNRLVAEEFNSVGNYFIFVHFSLRRVLHLLALPPMSSRP
jgi:hypothetical protein